MVSLLLPVIYLAFISLGLPDSLLGSAWPVMYQELGTSVSSAGIISMIIAAGTIVSSLNSDRLNTRFGTGKNHGSKRSHNSSGAVWILRQPLFSRPLPLGYPLWPRCRKRGRSPEQLRCPAL